MKKLYFIVIELRDVVGKSTINPFLGAQELSNGFSVPGEIILASLRSVSVTDRVLSDGAGFELLFHNYPQTKKLSGPQKLKRAAEAPPPFKQERALLIRLISSH